MEPRDDEEKTYINVRGKLTEQRLEYVFNPPRGAIWAGC